MLQSTLVTYLLFCHHKICGDGTYWMTKVFYLILPVVERKKLLSAPGDASVSAIGLLNLV